MRKWQNHSNFRESNEKLNIKKFDFEKMEQHIIIQNFANAKELASMMAEDLFVNHIKPFLRKNQAEKELVYFTRKETAEKLRCNLATLNIKMNEGVIEPTRFGAKVLFSNLDIEKALQKMANV